MKEEDVGLNLDTELVQEAEQEQEAIQQTANSGDGKPQFAKKVDKINRWRVTDLSSAAGMLDNNFYPLGCVLYGCVKSELYISEQICRFMGF